MKARPILHARMMSAETIVLLYPFLRDRLSELRSATEMRAGKPVIVYSVMDAYELWAATKIKPIKPKVVPADFDIQTDDLPAYIDYAGKRYFNTRRTMAQTGYSESRLKAVRAHVDTIERTWKRAKHGSKITFYEVESVLAYRAVRRGKKIVCNANSVPVPAPSL